MSKTPLRSVCVVTCYRQPDYVRAAVLAEGLKASGVFENVIEVRNKSKGIWRYAQVCAGLIKVRFTKNPDAYLLTFRGYEMLPFVLLIGLGKKVIYDEMVNPVEWFVYEHRRFKEGSLLAKLLRSTYRFLGKRTDVILADTPSHADYWSKLMDIPRSKYAVIPVGTNEKMFQPAKATRHRSDPFKVLYIGNMLPLYGVEYLLEAAVRLADRNDIVFHLVGGKKNVAEQVEEAKKRGANIIYESWVQYKDFPAMFHGSDLCLGGPFGKTIQSQFVITGKTFQFLAAGLPVLIGDNREAHQFHDTYDALIVPEADSKAIEKAIVWAEAHPKELAAIAKNGRELYEREFSSKRIAQDLRRLFLEQ